MSHFQKDAATEKEYGSCFDVSENYTLAHSILVTP